MAHIRAEITAHDANFTDVRVSFCNRGLQRGGQCIDIGDALAGRNQFPVRATRNLVPPDIAVKFFVHLQRQLRPAHLRKRIAVTRQRERATEAKFIFQHGFDNVRSLVELAIQRKEFTKHPDFKTKFVVPPELTHDPLAEVSGVEADLRTYFYTNTEAYDKLAAYMIKEINKTYWDKVEALGQPGGDDFEETDPNMVDLDGEL